MNSLAETYIREGKYAESETLLSRTLEIRRRVLGPENPDTLYAAGSLAICLSHEKQYEKAERLLREAIQDASKSGNTTDLGGLWYKFGRAAAVAGHKAAALEYLQKAGDLGYSEWLDMAKDDDLKSLRNDPRFSALITKAKERAAAGGL
jgi:tetratricopeptide (TPR) repeat protein